MLNLIHSILIRDNYCYQQLIINQAYVSISLLIYSHLPPAIISLVVGAFLYLKNRKLETKIFFLLTLTFFLFTIGDLTEWFVFLGNDTVMFARSIIEVVDPLLFVLSSYFLYVLIKKKDIPNIYKIIWLLPFPILAIFVLFGKNLIGYNWQICEAIENPTWTNWVYYLDLFYVISALLFATWSIITSKEKRKEVLISSIGVCSFMVLFFVMEYILTGYLFGSAFDYNYFLYAFFGMPILIIFLAYLTIKYKTFNTKLITTEILIVGIFAFIFAQYFFIENTIAIILNTVAFIGIAIFGSILIRSVKHEIAAKEALKIANERQTETTSLITHQIRGVFTNTKAGLQGIIDGDYDPASPKLKEVASLMFQSQIKGVDEVETFLRAQKIESGTVQYDHKPFDLKAVVEKTSAEEKPRADSKGLKYELHIDEGDYTLNGDQPYITQVIANLIDNAIRYTQTGSIKVQLSRKNDSILYSVKDSGVGIKAEDKDKMFTKYGHGTDSRKINAESSGLGLFIVKGIVDAHGGKIWYESEVGKGTTFFVELPVR